MKKVSVIIPMYQAQAYIRQCVLSAANQTYPDLEILVIDDGSVDAGPAIARELAAEDGRIQVLSQENQGVSAARNHGLDAAGGEYVFFLDSDDAIHPRLLEELVGRAEGYGAQLAFCGYGKMDGGQMEEALGRACGGTAEAQTQAADTAREAGVVQAERAADAAQEAGTRWQTADQEGTRDWFHREYTDIFSGIGGKLILRAALGELRFDRSLANGEDTWLLYQLIQGQVRSVYCANPWYYYRIHPESVTHSAGTPRGRRYFECTRRIRDGEYQKGRRDYAMRWEIILADQMRRSYESLRRAGERGEAENLRQTAAAEMRHPLFGGICLSDRMLFHCCCNCYPVYVILNSFVQILAKRRVR